MLLREKAMNWKQKNELKITYKIRSVFFSTPYEKLLFIVKLLIGYCFVLFNHITFYSQNLIVSKLRLNHAGSISASFFVPLRTGYNFSSLFVKLKQ